MNPALVLSSLALVTSLLWSEAVGWTGPGPDRADPSSEPTPQPRSAPSVRTVFAALPGTDRIAFQCALPCGHAEDPHFAATARILAAALRADVPKLVADAPVTTHITAGHTWLGGVVEVADFAAALHRLALWLSGDVHLDDAALERARDVAVLVMDDQAIVLPGPILRDRAQRALLGRGSTLDAATIELASRWSATDLRRRLHAVLRREGAVIAFAGGEDADALRRQVDAVFATLPERERGPSLAASAAASRSESVTMDEFEHDRVAAPFVTMALRVPPPDVRAAAEFRVAFELLRKRLVTELGKPRGGEARAQFPAFHFDPYDAGLAFVGRRGEDRDSAGTTRAEIETALERALSIPVGPSELTVIRSQLVAALAVPPLDAKLLELVQRMPSVQLERTRLLLADAMWGFPTRLAQDVAAIDAEAVARAMGEHFGPSARAFFALVPRKLASPTRR